MKLIFIACGFLAGVVFATNYPAMGTQIAQWVMNNQFMVGLLR